MFVADPIALLPAAFSSTWLFLASLSATTLVWGMLAIVSAGALLWSLVWSRHVQPPQPHKRPRPPRLHP